MECTKNEFNNAILELATQYGVYSKYEFELENDELALTEIVKRLGYDLFIRGFSYYDSTHYIKELYHIILQYDEELQKNGIVNFK